MSDTIHSGYRETVLASDYDALGAELAQWKGKYTFEIDEADARIAQLEAALKEGRRLVEEVITSGTSYTERLMETLWGDAAKRWLATQAETPGGK